MFLRQVRKTGINFISMGAIVIAMLLCCAVICSCRSMETGQTESASISPKPKVFAVQVNVTDIDQAIAIYGELGFEVVTRDYHPQFVPMKNGRTRLTLHKVEKATETHPNVARTNINLKIDNLDDAVQRLANNGFEVIHKTPQKAAVGIWKSIRDPFGNIINLMQFNQTVEGSAKPEVYNVTIKVTDIDRAVDWYSNLLGFDILSVKYYPPVIPLRTDGVISNIALHETAERIAQIDYPNGTQTFLVIEVSDLLATMEYLKVRGVEFIYETPQQAPIGIYTAFRDPFGLVHELVEIGER